MDATKFDDIAPIKDEDVKKTIQELLVDPGFIHAVKWVLPDIDWDEFSKEMSSYNTKFDFQNRMIAITVWGIARKTSSSVDCDGWENILDNTAHLIISNHRDIILDAGILNILLDEKGLPTTEIAIGDNLLIHPWIEKLVRLNKSFLVKRGVSVRQMLEVSSHMAEYIHYTITEKKESVWLAQREGRAKDSNDKTQESLLKMLALGSKTNSFINQLKELNITPLSISYEYDPCDYLKAMEFQQKRDNPEYKKTQLDDLRNMEYGLLRYKGRIHFRFGKNINDRLNQITTTIPKEQRLEVAKIIDNEIHRNYEIFPCNYIAYDLLNKVDKFKEMYSKEDLSSFNEYLEKQLDKIVMDSKDDSFLYNKLLEIYSNTLINHINSTEN